MDLQRNAQFHISRYGVRRDCVMRLSIIMPAFNAGKTIKMAIDSVTSILNDNVELIIVDDGSTDDTSVISSTYQEEYPSIRILKVPNGGVSNARNIGINNACGKYIMFMDSDDENLLSNTDLEILDNNPEFVLFSHTIRKTTGKEVAIKNDNMCVPVDELSQYIVCNYDAFSSPWAKIYKRDLIIQNDMRFIRNQKYGEDTSFVFTYLSTIKNDISVSDIVSYRYYLYANSASGFRTYYSEMNQYLVNILNSFLKINGSSNCVDKIANYLFDKAVMHYYINNNLKEFESNYLKTYDFFKDYINEETVNNEVLRYRFPVSEKNIKQIYIMNFIYKVKIFVKKIVWR